MCPDSDIFLPIDLFPGTRPVRSLSKVMRVFDLLYSYDRLTSIFMYPKNKKNRFLSWLENHFEDLVDHEVPACLKKYWAEDAPNLSYIQTMVICIFLRNYIRMSCKLKNSFYYQSHCQRACQSGQLIGRQKLMIWNIWASLKLDSTWFTLAATKIGFPTA